MIDPGCLVATPIFCSFRQGLHLADLVSVAPQMMALEGKWWETVGVWMILAGPLNFPDPSAKSISTVILKIWIVGCDGRWWQVPWCAATRIRTTACAFAAVAGPRFASNNGIPNRWSLGDLHFGKCPDDNVIDDQWITVNVAANYIPLRKCPKLLKTSISTGFSTKTIQLLG